MSDRAASLSRTRSPRNSLLAAGILVAIVAVLVGFHGVTMVLSAMSLGAYTENAAKPDAAKANSVQAAMPDSLKSSRVQPVREISLSRPVEAVSEPLAVADAERTVENPSVVAAAKAKAQAEMSRDLPAAAAASQAPRRQFRATRSDKHKVY